jgi:hypothetical protein
VGALEHRSITTGAVTYCASAGLDGACMRAVWGAAPATIAGQALPAELTGHSALQHSPRSLSLQHFGAHMPRASQPSAAQFAYTALQGACTMRRPGAKARLARGARTKTPAPRTGQQDGEGLRGRVPTLP